MVEWKKLGDIMNIVRGASPRPIKNYITEDVNGINWIKIGDVSSDAKYITSCNEKITKEGALKSRFLHKGDFILSNSMSFGRPYILKIDGCIHDGWIAMSNYENYVSSGYLFEILNSFEVQHYWKIKANNGGAMTNLNSDIVKETMIPIPPLKEQNRIVGILDTFTTAIDNLKKQIDERRKQYEFYRDQLLDLEGKEGVELKMIKTVCEKIENIKWKQEEANKEYLYIDLSSVEIANQSISSFSTITKGNAPSRAQQIVKTGDVLLGTTRPTLKRYTIIPPEYNNSICSSGFCVFRCNKSVNAKWIYHNLGKSDFWHYCEMKQQGAGYPCLSNSDAFAYTIPVPSIEEQNRIIAKLDTFEASIANLEQQLAMRQKQYEYYRNKLLTFE